MGLDLTWRDEDKIKFGNCGPDLTTIIEFKVPDSSGAASGEVSESPAGSIYYAIYDKRKQTLENLIIPEGKTGYALEFSEKMITITKEEASRRLRANLERTFPKDMEGREAYIDARVRDFIGNGPLGNLGTTFSGGMMRDERDITVTERRFVRWVSEEEYTSRLGQAQIEEVMKGDDEGYFLDAWFFLLNNQEKEAKCGSCQLNTYLGTKQNPIVEELRVQLKRKPDKHHRLLHDAYKQLVKSNTGHQTKGRFRDLVESNYQHLGEVVEFVAQSLGKIPHYQRETGKLRTQYNQWGIQRASCYRGSAYSHWSTFFDFIAHYGKFDILRNGFFESEKGSVGEVPTGLLGKLAGELKSSREILQTAEVPAINVYDKSGKLMEVYTYDTGWLYGDDKQGYGIGLEGKQEAISVVHQAPDIFDIPASTRKAVIDQEGLDGMLRLFSEMNNARPRYYFTRIAREGNTFYGTAVSGQRVELPAEKGPRGEQLTPFSGFEDGEKIGYVEYANASPMRSFGYLQRLLEKHLRIAQELQIPIEAR